jgi:organic radical activating enzyme
MKRIKPSEGNKTFCMAPWTHTYLSPQMERRLCCSSREDSKTFNQYIDLNKTSQPFSPDTLEEHWNSDYMKSIRRDLMAGKEIDQCQVCNGKLLSVATYRTHFNTLFEKQIDEAFEKTDDTGYTEMKVTSWDYRFNNLCNFKCRMCGDMLSSSWEAEERIHNMWDPNKPSQMWMRKDIREEIEKFHDKVVVKEFADAVESKTIKEIYWCGGEPLMWKIHWESMKRILELGYQDEVSIRYNSNMSKINYYGMNLFDDLLSKFPHWNVLASIDGAGDVGEYIRTGLNFNEWLKNMEHGRKFVKNKKQLRMDLTMTMPGLVGLEEMLETAEYLDVDLLAKRVFGFSPDNIWSPMCLPKKILNNIIDDFISKNKQRLTRHTYFYTALLDLKQKPTYDEMFKDKYVQGLKKGKARVLKLDLIRGTDIETILAKDERILEWWKSI